MVVRIAANLDELRKNLAEGKNQIETTSAAMQKLAKSFDSGKLVQAAHDTVAAIGGIEGVAKLTDVQMARVNRTLKEAIQYYDRVGKEAPSDIRKVYDATTKVGTATESWTASVGKMATGYLAGMATFATAQRAIGGVVDFLKSSVEEAAKAEAAQKRLVTAMRTTGTAADGNVRAFEALATQMQRTTVYEDDQIKSLIAMGLQLGVLPTHMEPAIKAAANLASGLGVDLETAMRMIVKGNNESYTAFQRLGISIDAARAKAEGLPYILDQINAGMGGQAAAEVETYAGRIAQLGNEWGDLKEAIGGIIVANGLLAESFGTLTEILRGATTVISDLKGQLAGLAIASMTGANGIIGYLRLLGQIPPPKIDPSQVTNGTMQMRQGLSDAQQAIVRLQKSLEDYGKSSEPVWTKTTASAKAAEPPLRTLAQVMADLGMTAGATAPKLTMLGGQLVGLGQSAKQALPFLGWAGQNAGGTLVSTGLFDKTIVKLTDVTDALQTTGGATKTVESSFKANLGKAADVVDLLSRAAEMSGHKTTAALLSTASATAKAFASGGPWAAAMTAASGLLTTFWSKLFGSAEAKKDYAATDQIKKLQAELLKTYGSLEGIARAGGNAGAELVAAWGDRSQAGLKHFQQLLDEFNRKVGDSRTELAALQAQLADRSKMDWERAQELIEKYGGTLASLGTQFVAAKQAASWKEVWDDWQTLIDMGADVGGVLVSMSDEIQALVQQSLKIGTEIPAQFKPLIEELIRTGKLFDENGNAIEDIAKLKFGAPLVSEVDKIIKKIDELIEALTGGLVDAFQVATNVRVPVIKIPYEYEATNELPGGPAPHVPGFATGTGGQFLNFGAGTLAMLHGYEAVVPRGQAGPAAAPVVITVVSQLDGKEVARNQVRYLPNQLALAGV
jgi:hypothetical protein